MGNKELGLRLKRARERVNKTQKEVCNEAGIPKEQTLSAYENAVNSPPLDTLKKLCTIYNVSADYLLFGEEHRPAREMSVLSVRECAKLFVDLADKLELPIFEEEIEETLLYCIVLEGSTFLYQKSDTDAFNAFVKKWYQLRKAKESNVIDYSDYHTIISKRLEELPDGEDFWLLADTKLPF